MITTTVDCEGVELICELEHEIADPSDEIKALYESRNVVYDPTATSHLTLVSALHKGEDIAHLLLQYLVDEIELKALNQLEKTK